MIYTVQPLSLGIGKLPEDRFGRAVAMNVLTSGVLFLQRRSVFHVFVCAAFFQCLRLSLSCGGFPRMLAGHLCSPLILSSSPFFFFWYMD